MVIRIGSYLRTDKLIAGDGIEPRVLASVGMSTPADSVETEVYKAKIAQKYGADIVIDHTLTPLNYEVQKRILNEVNLPLSAIAVYDVASEVLFSQKDYYTEEDVLLNIERKASLGVDMLTIHASVRKSDLTYFQNSGRIIPCTSRGGTMVLKNIQKTGEDNYYFTYYDEILKIAKKYGTTISLGAVFRPASISDALYNNEKYWEEINRNAELAKRAVGANVPVMVEGIGHCPLNLIPSVVRRSKEICKVPYRVLSVATDSALGFDHVSSAIAVANEVMNGADFVTAVSRSEHLGLPSVEDLKEAVISAKIAAHCGYIARTGDISKDLAMAESRRKNGCKGSIDASVVPEMTKEALSSHKLTAEKKCSMCGPFCALSSGDVIKNGAHDQ